ncbi:5-methylcytosine restriction system specificity protein McrC [Micromonospora gifhornensis]|uniref:5-methylcytosine restriction system specificity protein McrC n=1 Tax=Micromonospora gifhornensis TaxID=84594 RepID=UPI0036499FE2
MYETEFSALSTTASAMGALATSLADVGRSQADLLGLGAPPEDPVLAAAVPDDPFRNLIDLMLLAERGRLTTSPLEFEGAFAPSLLRLITHERLLQVVESLIFRARPRYAEQTEVLELPRGRLSERSLLFSIATGTPRVESSFDELTMDTPLLQVVASALRVVASERLPRKIAALRPGLQARAVHLLRYLSGVSLVSRERALLTAERLWLNPLDRIWEPAMEAAMPVLRGHAVTPENGSDDSESLLVHISTEKFWEQCLELALASAFPSLAVSRSTQAGEGVSVPAPWAPPATAASQLPELGADAFPDFMFRSSRRVVVADAKYKLHAGGAPNSDDGYQLFAYSHLASLGGQASDLALVLYPTRCGGSPQQLKLERLRDRDYPLWLVRLPFPTRGDLQRQGSWSAFLAQLAQTIRYFSTEWVERDGGASAA